MAPEIKKIWPGAEPAYAPPKDQALDAQSNRNLEAFAAFIAEDQENQRWQLEKVRLIESLLDELRVGGALADIGCFTGAATVRFLAHGFQSAVGFDASAPALEAARRRGIEARQWTAGAQPCPARDAEFDLVIAADVIEHLIDTDHFLTELRRIVRPGCYAIVTTPNLAFWLSRLRLMLGKTPWSYPGVSPTIKVDSQVDLNHIRISTFAEWKGLFHAHGFTVERVRGWSIMHAIGGGPGVRLRKYVDRLMTARPSLAFGLLFLLKTRSSRVMHKA